MNSFPESAALTYGLNNVMRARHNGRHFSRWCTGAIKNIINITAVFHSGVSRPSYAAFN